ncbi:hypothetical protein T484DRAFT_1834915 [Baffinella frigidus]|nr:hypothetical protein T484DRAFT_1834915 [Cryptophyta sp. CCMP2293]
MAKLLECREEDATLVVASTSPQGIGAADTDLLVFVTMQDDGGTCAPGGGTIAYAGTCQRDQNDRPVVGHLTQVPTDARDIEGDLAVAIHELMHIVGFSSAGDLAVEIHELMHIVGFSSASFPLHREASRYEVA